MIKDISREEAIDYVINNYNKLNQINEQKIEHEVREYINEVGNQIVTTQKIKSGIMDKETDETCAYIDGCLKTERLVINNIRNQITDTEARLSKLGLFKGKEKKQCAVEIEELKDKEKVSQKKISWLEDGSNYIHTCDGIRKNKIDKFNFDEKREKVDNKRKELIEEILKNNALIQELKDKKKSYNKEIEDILEKGSKEFLLEKFKKEELLYAKLITCIKRFGRTMMQKEIQDELGEEIPIRDMNRCIKKMVKANVVRDNYENYEHYFGLNIPDIDVAYKKLFDVEYKKVLRCRELKSKDLTDKQIENELIKEDILEYMREVNTPVTISNIANDFDNEYSIPQISVLVNQLKKSGKVIREEYKRIGFFKLVN